jgi:hypothetical protein
MEGCEGIEVCAFEISSFEIGSHDNPPSGSFCISLLDQPLPFAVGAVVQIQDRRAFSASTLLSPRQPMRQRMARSPRRYHPFAAMKLPIKFP